MSEVTEALFAAVRESRPDDLAAMLAAGAAPDTRRRPGTLLHEAAQRARPAIVRLLLDAGASVDPRSDYHARTPLYHASGLEGENARECVRLLLERGADIEAREHQGATPLFAGVLTRSEEPVRQLLLKGASVDARDESGRTPLLVAAREVAIGPTRELLTFGAAPLAADESGWTALHHAVLGYSEIASDNLPAALEVVDALLAAGADPARPSSAETAYPIGTTATDLARTLKPPARGALLARLNAR